jgi:uncharacterized protein YfbU (UPF0304 family)
MEKQLTPIQELIKEFENIKETKCNTLQEVIFFDGVLAIIESKYLAKEKKTIIETYDKGYTDFDFGHNMTGEAYYKEKFNNKENGK